METNATPMMKEAIESTNCAVRLRIDGANEGRELIIVDEDKKSKSTDLEKTKPDEDMTEFFSNDDTTSCKDEFNAGGMRRQSLALSRSNSKGSVSSRYLKPSCGSCHDFCKFGHRDPLEDKATHAHVNRPRNEDGDVFEAQRWKISGVRRLSLTITIGEKESKLLLKESRAVRSSLGMSRNLLDTSTPKVREIKSSNAEERSAALASEFVSLMPQLEWSKTTSPRVYKEFSSSQKKKVTQAYVNRPINEYGDDTGGVSGAKSRKRSKVRRLSLPLTVGEKDFKESKAVKSPLGMSRNSLDTSSPKAREIKCINREGRAAALACEFISLKPQLERSKTTGSRVYKELSGSLEEKVAQAHVNRPIDEHGDVIGGVFGAHSRKISGVRRLSLPVTVVEKDFKESRSVKSPLGMSQNSLDTSTPKVREINCSNREGRSSVLASEFISLKPQVGRSKTSTSKVCDEFSSSMRAKTQRNLQQAEEPENSEGVSLYSSEEVNHAQRLSCNGGQTSHSQQKNVGAREDTLEPLGVKILKPENASYKQNEPAASSDDKPRNTAPEGNPCGRKKASVWEMKCGRETTMTPSNVTGSPRKLQLERENSLIENFHVEETNPKNDDAMEDGLERNKYGSVEVHKQQEESAKKEIVDLHNVIGKNVSKLVKVGRTKVKAMVRLFEALMSMED